MDLEDLLNKWKKFNLRGKEKKPVIYLDAEEIKDINGQLDHILVGKLLSNRNISAMAIKNALNGARRTRENFMIEILGKNLFLFKFESQDNRDWIIKNGPWLFDKYLLILESHSAN